MNLSPDIARACAPLFEALPLGQAMEQLVVKQGADAPTIALVEDIVGDTALDGHPALVAGLWLYVDELNRSHDVSQQMTDPTGSFWHGIMHRREGDFGNSHYWFQRTGFHPAMNLIDGYDPHAFIDAVSTAASAAPGPLIETQRAEWAALFQWCSREA